MRTNARCSLTMPSTHLCPEHKEKPGDLMTPSVSNLVPRVLHESPVTPV